MSSNRTVCMLTHYAGSECLGYGWGTEHPRIHSKSPRVKLQSVRSVCPSLLYSSTPRAVQLTASHLHSALWSSTWVAVWGPGSSHVLWAAILCSRLHPLTQLINGASTSCSSFCGTLWESTGKKYITLSLPIKGELNRCSLQPTTLSKLFDEQPVNNCWMIRGLNTHCIKVLLTLSVTTEL